MSDEFVTGALYRLLEQLEEEGARLGEHEVRYIDGDVEELHVEVFNGDEPGEPEDGLENTEETGDDESGGFVSPEELFGEGFGDEDESDAGTDPVPGGPDSADARDVGGSSADASEVAERLGEMIEEYGSGGSPRFGSVELSLDEDSDAADAVRHGSLEGFSIGFDSIDRDGVAGEHPGPIEHEFSMGFGELSLGESFESIADGLESHLEALDRTLLELDTTQYRGVEVTHFKPDVSRMMVGESGFRPPEIRKVPRGEWWPVVDEPADFEPGDDVFRVEAFDAPEVEEIRSELLYDDETVSDIRLGKVSMDELRRRARELYEDGGRQ